MKIDAFYLEAAELTRRDLVKQKMLLPPETIAALCENHHRTPRLLAESIKKRSGNDLPKVVAGIQKIFPGAGTMVNDFKPLEMAQNFESARAGALAVVTEKHFYGGEPKHLTGITHLVKLPVIRWDFIVESYQIQQSRLWGADAVRIIVKLLDQSDLLDICRACEAHSLEIVAEIHDYADLERLRDFPVKITAITVDTGNSDINAAANLLKMIPDEYLKWVIADHLNDSDLRDLPCDAVCFFEKIALSPALIRAFGTA